MGHTGLMPMEVRRESDPSGTGVTDDCAVLLRVLLLLTDTMTKATLKRTIFNWGWLTGSEVQSIIIKRGT